MSRGTQERVRSNVSKTMGIKLDGGINAISLNKDSTQVVAAGRQVFKIFHIEEMGFRERIDLRVGRMNLNYSCNDVAWHPSKDELIATGATNGAVITWDLNKAQGNKMDQVFNDHKRTVHKVSFHPREWYMLFSGSNDGSMKFFDLRTNKCETTYGNGQSECIRDVQCSPHQYFILAATLDNGHIQFWDYRCPDKVLLDFPGHNGPAFNLDWHPEESKLIATCGRDKIIKIWRWEGHGNVLEPEYTIYAIASVNHIKWRPEKKHHIASCSGVVDHTICVWDVRRSYMPFAVFEEHKDVVTGIAWRQDPHVFLSGSKDSMLYQHKFKDAKRPAESANPVGVSMSIYDDVCHAFNKSSARTNMQAQQNYASTNFPMRFRRTPDVSEHYERYESSLLVHERKEATFSESFIQSARRYLLTGKPFPELCEHNAQVALDLGRYQIAQTWRMLRLFYCTDTTSATPPVYTNKGIPPTEAAAFTNDSDKDISAPQFGLNHLPSHHDFLNLNPTASSAIDSATGVTDDNDSVISDSEHDHALSGAPTRGKRRHCSQDGALGAVDFYFPLGEGEEEEEEEEEEGGVFGRYGDEMQEWNDYVGLPTEAFGQRHEIQDRPPSPDMLQDRIRPESPVVPLLDLEPAITVNSQLFPSARSLNQTPSKQLPELQLSIKFTPIVVNMLSDYAEQGDVQMAVSAFIVLDNKIRNEIASEIQEQWFMSYIELLSRFKLWCVSNQVIKLSKHPAVESLNQQSTTVYTKCNRCNQTLEKLSWVCFQKNRQSFTNPCSICHLPVKGLYAWCQGCSHGGHLEHIREWLKTNQYCPTGCGHQCEYT
ncbi:GATOR complex protein WDR24-like isoform X2 [Lytechinus variegatus]|uniref:GATOR complex protein WDR24-like isoform X2 n=1 Tax=Lytechinus variegatus TaxID=7654 RepID=UPI001BB0DF96|nr:GATOR complex protein WDR24-like isoform X2 [Lytechinus variegatus]